PERRLSELDRDDAAGGPVFVDPQRLPALERRARQLAAAVERQETVRAVNSKGLEPVLGRMPDRGAVRAGCRRGDADRVPGRLGERRAGGQRLARLLERANGVDEPEPTRVEIRDLSQSQG